MSPAIDVEQVVKRFGEHTALDRVSFRVERSEVFGLLGPNGAGKTTMINVLSTLLAPDSGTARVDGHDVLTEPRSVRRSIALTGQFSALDEMLTGHENLTLFGRLRGLPRGSARARADELLARFALDDAGRKPVGTYSGGMRRRLDLAASLVVPAAVIFLDEPTTGLDPRSRAELWDVVRELRDEGRTIVLTTQYLEEADQLAERVVVIDHGEIVAEGTPDELKRRTGGQSCILAPADPARLAELARLVDGALGDAAERAADADAATITITGVHADQLAVVLRDVAETDIELADLALRLPTLDEVFLQLTGHRAEPGTAGTATREPDQVAR